MFSKRPSVLLHLLKSSVQLSKDGEPSGFLFNLSVGYDLKCIQSEKMERFLGGMLSPEEVIETLLEVVIKRLPCSAVPQILTTVVINGRCVYEHREFPSTWRESIGRPERKQPGSEKKWKSCEEKIRRVCR